MPTYQLPLAAGTGGSVVVDRCQICGDPNLESILFLGYLPPVNTMPLLNERPREQAGYPAELLICPTCKLVQIGLVVDPNILFPPEYPYTSGTTRILRENFAQLYEECAPMLGLEPDDLVVDIGSNDGTLLSNFTSKHRIMGIEPTDASKLANSRNIPTLQSFFNQQAVQLVVAEHGKAALVTAANVFAHIEDIHSVLLGILDLLSDDGVFISESHYFLSLVETLQYDTIYHEHLRYYSLHSLKYLLEMHGLEVFHARRIPTHGGSIRVYAARTGSRPVQSSVAALLQQEIDCDLMGRALETFKREVVLSKMRLHQLLLSIKEQGARIYAIGAPSRASTLVNYVGLDNGILDCVLEIKGSYKIGKYMPGTRIPVVDEAILFEDQPEFALLLSWHIAEELAPKLAQRGYKGKFIVPLVQPRILQDKLS
jgi:hypothetical protein